jgi:hypothetical protein
MGLTGRWRIMETDRWNLEDIDLMESGFIEFSQDRTGQFGFLAVRGWMDCRHGERGGRACVEFTWAGEDEGDQVSGRGWAGLTEDGSLGGHLFFHLADDSGFRAVRAAQEPTSTSAAQGRR